MCTQLGAISKHAGVAGQIAYSASVTYDNEPPQLITFVGSTFGGPVVMVTSTGAQVFVIDHERFGTFGPEWVRRFFTD
jgi:hypothetical protein